MLGVGCFVLGVCYCMLGLCVGCLRFGQGVVFGVGCLHGKVVDVRCWCSMFGIGCLVLSVRCWLLDFGCLVFGKGIGVCFGGFSVW